MLDESPENKKLNPFLSIWFQPRKTIQYIISQSSPGQLIIFLAVLAGINRVLARGPILELGKKFDLLTILLIVLVVGPLTGIAGLYLQAFGLRLTGRLLGGQADSSQLRAALAWSSLPMLLGLVLWIPQIAILGRYAFVKNPGEYVETGLMTLMLEFKLEQLILSLWSIVLQVKCVSEVQRVSIGKAILNIILMILFLIPFYGLFGLYYMHLLVQF